MNDPLVVLMLKEPVAGEVKTRLAQTIGAAAAAGVYRALICRLMRRLAGAPGDIIIAVNRPPAALRRSWHRRFGLPLVPQGRGSLGDRMRRLNDAAPSGPVLFLGADTPDVDRTDIAAATRRLGGHDAVFGPATDGGYWLAGLARRRPAPDVFERVRWSSEHALADTIASLPVRAKIARLRTLADIDTDTDYRVWLRLV